MNEEQKIGCGLMIFSIVLFVAFLVASIEVGAIAGTTMWVIFFIGLYFANKSQNKKTTTSVPDKEKTIAKPHKAFSKEEHEKHIKKHSEIFKNLNNSQNDTPHETEPNYLSDIKDVYENESFTNAIKISTKAIKLFPSVAEFYFYRALAKSKTNNKQGAIIDFNKAIELNSKCSIDDDINFITLKKADYLTARGETFLSMNNYLKAKQDISEAINIGNELSYLESFTVGNKKADILYNKYFDTTCENNTNYSIRISKIEHPYFNSIRQLSVDYIMSLSEDQKDELWEKLNHGLDIYEEEELLYHYMYSFGQMHKAKLKTAFDVFVQSKLSQETIEIIDYGCGQGMATTVFLDYLQINEIKANIKQVTLIEPSKIALARGILHLNSIKKVPVKPICDEINNITSLDLTTNKKNSKLHLFSNILDVDKFSISDLATKIINTQKGNNYFVCVSPCNYDTDRIDAFFEFFNRKFHLEKGTWKLIDCSKNWYPDKNWTIYAKIFGVDFDNNTRITLSNEIEKQTNKQDEFMIRINSRRNELKRIRNAKN